MREPGDDDDHIPLGDLLDQLTRKQALGILPRRASLPTVKGSAPMFDVDRDEPLAEAATRILGAFDLEARLDRIEELITKIGVDLKQRREAADARNDNTAWLAYEERVEQCRSALLAVRRRRRGR